MPDQLIIRADASPVMGVGHVLRMMSVAEAWREAGGEVTFVTAAPEAVLERVRAAGFSVVVRGEGSDVSETTAVAQSRGGALVLADGYGFGPEFQRGVRDAGLRLALVDDNGENREYCADLIVNLNVHANEAMYARREPLTKLLLGTQYALIRGELRRAAQGSNAAPPRVARRVLITMGGADPTDATGALLSVLRATPSSRASFEFKVLVGPANQRLESYRQRVEGLENVELLSNVAELAPVYAWAELALCPASTTVWELGLFGVPCIVATLADNQAGIAHTLVRQGAVALLGDARVAADGARWMETLVRVANDWQTRVDLVQRARSLVDGRGALRVVDALKELVHAPLSHSQ